MTDSFTASNGITIHLEESAMPVFARPATDTPFSPEERMQALREYFQHERDQKLGRWRDPEAPDVAVYHLPSAKREATGRRVRVLDERLGATVICSEHLERSSDPTNAEPSAARYFAAHPEPKPWHSAEPGEVWLLTINDEQAPATVTEHPEFLTYHGDYYPITSRSIAHATRIWPTEGDSDE